MTIGKRKTKTVTIYEESYNVLKSIATQVNPPATMAECVEMLVQMYEDAPEEYEEQVQPIVNQEPVIKLSKEQPEPIVIKSQPANKPTHTILDAVLKPMATGGIGGSHKRVIITRGE